MARRSLRLRRARVRAAGRQARAQGDAGRAPPNTILDDVCNM